MESLSNCFDLGVDDGKRKPTAKFNFQLLKTHFMGYVGYLKQCNTGLKCLKFTY